MLFYKFLVENKKNSKSRYADEFHLTRPSIWHEPGSEFL